MLLISALEIFLTWAVIAIALIGLGFVVLALFGRDHSLIDAFWMGLAISVAVLEIWNLLLPVTSSIALFLFGIGLFGLAVSRSKLRAGLLAAWQNSRWLLLLGVAFALLRSLRLLRHWPLRRRRCALESNVSRRSRPRQSPRQTRLQQLRLSLHCGAWARTLEGLGLSSVHRVSSVRAVGHSSAGLRPMRQPGRRISRRLVLLYPRRPRIFLDHAFSHRRDANRRARRHRRPCRRRHPLRRPVRNSSPRPTGPARFAPLFSRDSLLPRSHLQGFHRRFRLARLVPGLPPHLANQRVATAWVAPRCGVRLFQLTVASLVGSLDYLEWLSAFPRHHLRVPCSVEDAALRRAVVRARRSLLGTRSRRSFCRHPRLALARRLGESCASQPPIVPGPPGHRTRRSGHRARESLPRRTQSSSLVSLALASDSFSRWDRLLVYRFAGPALCAVRHLDRRCDPRHLGRCLFGS